MEVESGSPPSVRVQMCRMDVYLMHDESTAKDRGFMVVWMFDERNAK